MCLCTIMRVHARVSVYSSVDGVYARGGGGH